MTSDKVFSTIPMKCLWLNVQIFIEKAIMKNHKISNEKDPWLNKLKINGFIAILVLIFFLFLSAGRLDYWQGWVFIGMIFIRILAGIIIISDKADLYKERMKPGPGTKLWDKILIKFLIVFSIAMFIIAPLDAGRFKWSMPLSVNVYAVSYLLFWSAVISGLWAVRVNKFFSSVVRIQTDRGQKVIQNGPYRFIRHPGYAGMILMFIGIPLMLGSLWALIPAGINIIVLIIRTYLEDITLQKELTGYTEYAAKVRKRLFPGIW